MQNNLRNRISLAWPKTRSFRLGLASSLLQGFSAVALLATSAWLISRAAEQPPVMYLMVAVVGVRGFALGRAAFRYGERISLHDSAFRMLAALRPRIFEKLIPFSPAGLAGNKRAEVLSKLTSDVDELQNLPLRVISPLAQSLFVSVLTVIGMSLLLPSAALVLAATLLIAFVVALPASALASKRADDSMASTKAQLNVQLIEILENQELWHSLGWLQHKTKAIAATDLALSKAVTRNSFAIGFGQALFSLLATLATLGTTFFGAQAVSEGQQPGVLLALFALVPMAVFDVLSASQASISAWQKYAQSADRVNQLLERKLPEELAEAAGQLELGPIETLQLKNAEIGYPNAPSTVSNLDLQISQGETLLIHGVSGAGKTTAALTLANLLNVRSGEYLINGVPADEFAAHEIRNRIGYLEQNPTIFKGTVRANLLVAKPEAEDVELELVLHTVGMSGTFKNREGLDTQLGERGVLISGGEAQRLALARALLKGFDVLILDEPTANVDQEMAFELVSDLLQIAKRQTGRAVILITHDEQLGKLTQKSIAISR